MKKKKPVILIVDDDKVTIEILKLLLKNDYKTLEATNGKIAIEKAEKKKPDLILLDVMMPVMDGYEACSHLKKNPETSNIPVIFITSKYEDGQQYYNSRT